MLRRSRRSSTRPNANARWNWLAYITAMVMVLTALPMSLIQPTATSAQAGPDRTYSWIVEKRECPPGFDPASSSPDVANNTCPPVTGVPFTLSSDNPAYPGDTRFAINGGNGQLAWNDLPANTTYSVTEEIPLGYEQAAISCVLYADPNNPNAGNGDPGFSYGPGGVSAYLPAEGYDGLNTVFCRFYNVPSNQNGQENGAQPTEETGGTENEAATILLRKYTCVQRFDEEDESRPSLLDRCRQGMPGTRFAVSSGNGQPQIIDVNQNGEANYAMFPGGTVDIAERDTAWPHPMQPIVYCALQTNGSPAPEPMRADVQPNGRITYDVQGGQTLVCDWFNIFLSTGVQLLKLACPEDIDPVSSDLQFLRERCVPQPGVHFDIEIEDQDGSTLTSGPTRPDGRSAPTLFNTSQPQATYQSTIVETVPEGYASSRVFCSMARQNEYPDPVTEVQLSTSNSYSFEQPWDSVVACAWFNFIPKENGNLPPTETQEPNGYGQVIVQKYLCSDGYPSGGSYDDFANACSNSNTGSGYGFSVAVANYGYQESQTTDSAGHAEWPNVPAGTVEITEADAPGYVPVAVYCGWDLAGSENGPDTYSEVTLVGSTIAYELTDNLQIVCKWFNAPENVGAVDENAIAINIHKYVCPVGYDPYEVDDVDAARSMCVEPQGGVTFGMEENGEAAVESQTDADGNVTLPYYGKTGILYEIPPPGYQTGGFYCALITGSGPQSYQRTSPYPDDEYPITTGGVPLGSVIDCYWFNIPIPGANGENGENGNGATATVYIHKFSCPEGYDPYTVDDVDIVRSMCVNPQSGVTFGLEEDGHPTTEVETDLNGDATLPYYGGAGSLYELPPPGYQAGALYCAISANGETGLYERLQVMLDNHYPVSSPDLPPGTTIDCYWFNVPVEGANGENGNGANTTVYIHKFSCPDGYDPYQADDVDAARSMCVNPQSGVTIGLEEDGHPATEVETDLSGDATLPYYGEAGLLYELPPPGYQASALYCSISASGETGPYERFPVMLDNQASVLAPNLPPGTIIDCYWFNVPDGVLDTVDDVPARVDIRKYVCPAGYDYGSAGLSALIDSCGTTPQQGVQYHADDGNGGTTNITDSDGYAAFAGLIAGPVTVKEFVPDGYQARRVYCYAVDAGAGIPAFDEYEQVPLNPDGSVDVYAPGGSIVECYWFNEPVEVVTGIVTIFKYRCPEGFVPESIDLDYLRGYCDQPHVGVEYTATWNDGPSQPMTIGESGYAEWENATGGSLEIQETLQPGYETLRVYCAPYSAGMGTPEAYQLMTVSGSGRINYELPAGYGLDCYWFNAPVVENDEGYGSVTVYKLVCPDGYDPASYSRDYLASYCVEPYTGIEFSLDREGSPSEPMTVSMDGTAYWPSVPGGSIQITESVPTGYVAAGVYCDDYASIGSPGDYQGVSIVNGSTVSYDLPDGYSLTCYWYNAPYEQEAYGNITVTKYVCPAEYDTNSVNRDYLSSTCTETQGGVEYQLYRDDGSSSPMTTSDEGEATWSQVYGGPLELRETPADGYQTLRVYCATYPASGTPSDYQSLPVSEGTSVYYDLAPGYSLTCSWYNAPVEGGSIELVKYACPDGYAPSSGSPMSIADSCQQRLEGVNFSLEPRTPGDDESQSATTDVMGEATFDNVPYGSYFDLTESYPSGYNAAVVYCSRYVPHYGAMTAYEPYAVSNGSIAVSLDQGEYLRCRWYNLATAYGADVHLTKYDCADDAWSMSEDELAATCMSPMPDVQFYLSYGDQRSGGTTSSSGEVGWEGVTAGVARIEEVAPDGYGNRFRVYCRVSIGGQDGVWQSVAIQDGVGIEYGLSDGQTLDCRWYNFPIVETGAYVVVTKYLCDPNADLISASRIGLKSRCVPLSGVQFSLATSGEPSWYRLTGPSGQASWDAVPSGEFGLAERTTSGYRTPIVYCSVNGGPYERVIVSGGSIQQVVAESDEVRCDWYNVPTSQVSGPAGSAAGTGPSSTGQVPLGGNQGTPSTQTGSSSGSPFSTGGNQTPTANQGTGPATLTIASYICPSGFDLYATESEPRVDCDEGEEPISYTLTPWGEDATGDPVTRSTGAPQLNVVTFTNVDAGDYMVSLEPPDDPIIAWAFVLTCESSLSQADSSRFYPLALTGDDLGLRLTLYAGETLRCSWYNVPEASNLVDVTVYECPGRIANPSRCVPAVSLHVIYFMPIDAQLETVSVETDSEGTATAELAPGAYTVEDEALTACLVDSSSMDDDGNLIVEGEDAIEVVVYTCSG